MKLNRLMATVLLPLILGLVAQPFSVLAIEVAQVRTTAPNQPAGAPVPPIQQQPTNQQAPAERSIWHHGHSLRPNADWATANYRVNKEGQRLVLSVQGTVELQSAQVQFDDGQTQAIQPQTQPYGSGEYLLLDFGSKRRVQSVQVVGRTNARKSAYSVHLLK